MSILYQNKFGWILDQHQLISDTYRNTVINGLELSFKYKHDFFEINSPFMMDSQFNARTQIGQDVDSRNSKKRKRKRKSDLNEGEIKAKELHEEILKILLLSCKSLLNDVEEKTIFKHKNNVCLDNNQVARDCLLTVKASDLDDFCSSCSDISTDKFLLKADGLYESLVNQPICNIENSAIRIKIKNEFYLIPQNCEFIKGDVNNLNCFTDTLGVGEFNFILLDPPWESKSVKRLKQYWTLRNEDFLKIPIQELSAHDCVVAIWVTNRVKHINFIKDELFPFWNVCYVTTWYWLKMTQSGETVYDINSEHKKPYEILILGICNKSSGIESNKVTFESKNESAGDNDSSGIERDNISDESASGNNYSKIISDNISDESAGGNNSSKIISDNISDETAGDNNSYRIISGNISNESGIKTDYISNESASDNNISKIYSKVESGEISNEIASDKNSDETAKANNPPKKFTSDRQEYRTCSPKFSCVNSQNKDLPSNMTIISVPASIHSMKIPLIKIMKHFLPDNPKCLEIFARNLQPGWVSFGNEVYKHQHVDYFEKL